MLSRITRRDVLLVIAGGAVILFFTNVLSPRLPERDPIFGLNIGLSNPLAAGPLNDDLSNPLVEESPPDTAPTNALPATTWNVTKGHRDALPLTRIVKHAPGWTMFENLYMSGGTLFIMTDQDVETMPEIRLMTSTGLRAENTPENIQMREPTRNDMDFLTPPEAQAKWKGGVWPIEGTSFVFNDPSQFLAHYYHGCAELIFGTWSFYSGTYDPDVDERGNTKVPPVARAIFPHAETRAWRDGSKFNAYFLYSAFPGIAIEGQEGWEDRVFMTRKNNKAWVFERALLTDRSAAFRGRFCGSINQRTASEAFEAVKDHASKWWWEPIRRSVLGFAGISQTIIDLNINWPGVGGGGDLAATVQQPIVISYISRQGTDRRRLLDKDHTGLVEALKKLADDRGYEFNVVDAGSLSQEEQLTMAARTTIMVGVHGNGLTHLLLMAPTPVSAVIEIFYPEGFAHDYEWTTRAVGIRHFSVWNDKYFTEPNEPPVNYPDPGFQGDKIPVHGPTVAELIRKRLDGEIPGY